MNPRTIYLLRHGEPAFSLKKKVCIGVSDLSLSIVGRMQSVLLSDYFNDRPVSVAFCSEMKRAKETAAAIWKTPQVCLDLREIGVGEWEGLSFVEIQKRYPILYARRSEDPVTNIPPKGEQVTACRDRALHALSTLLSETDGDIAIVAHAGINRLILCSVLNLPLQYFLRIPQPYGCINILRWERSELRALTIAQTHFPQLTNSLCKSLWDVVSLPEQIREHCRIVATMADHMALKLEERGYVINRRLLHNAALLHDIARREKKHVETGAAWIFSIGYPQIANIISQHHDLLNASENTVSEASILFWADKQVDGTEIVGTKERFIRSRKRCDTDCSLLAHERRLQQALYVEKILMQAVGGIYEKIQEEKKYQGI